MCFGKEYDTHPVTPGDFRWLIQLATDNKSHEIQSSIHSFVRVTLRSSRLEEKNNSHKLKYIFFLLPSAGRIFPLFTKHNKEQTV